MLSKAISQKKKDKYGGLTITAKAWVRPYGFQVLNDPSSNKLLLHYFHLNNNDCDFILEQIFYQNKVQ